MGAVGAGGGGGGESPTHLHGIVIGGASIDMSPPRTVSILQQGRQTKINDLYRRRKRRRRRRRRGG